MIRRKIWDRESGVLECVGGRVALFNGAGLGEGSLRSKDLKGEDVVAVGP